MSSPCLSVVLPSRDGASRLPETLASIAAQEVNGEIEVVVVDDGSSDATSEVAASFRFPWGTARVPRHSPGRGRAAARNTGLREATSPVVVFLDDDMTLRQGALEAHRRFHERHVGAVALGRVVLAPGGPATAFSRFLAREERDRDATLRERAEAVPFRFFLTGHFSAPKGALDRVGEFDETIARYGFEDTEFGYRLASSGVPIRYLPEAESVHRAFMTDLGRYLDRHREAGRVARQLAARFPSGPFREYLRLDGPASLGLGSAPAGLVGLRIANRLLLLSPFRRTLASCPGTRLTLWALRTGEALGLDRLVHFGYHVARDVRFFQGCFDDPPEGTPS